MDIELTRDGKLTIYTNKRNFSKVRIGNVLVSGDIITVAVSSGYTYYGVKWTHYEIRNEAALLDIAVKGKKQNFKNEIRPGGNEFAVPLNQIKTVQSGTALGSDTKSLVNGGTIDVDLVVMANGSTFGTTSFTGKTGVFWPIANIMFVNYSRSYFAEDYAGCFLNQPGNQTLSFSYNYDVTKPGAAKGPGVIHAEMKIFDLESFNVYTQPFVDITIRSSQIVTNRAFDFGGV